MPAARPYTPDTLAQKEPQTMTTINFEMPPDLAERLREMDAKLDRLTAHLAPPADLLTTEDAAKIMRVTPATVRKMAREGRLPVAVRIGAQMRFSRASVISR